MIINTNLASLNTTRQLGINEKNTQSSLSKLSSGFRINSAADDAAGVIHLGKNARSDPWLESGFG